MVLLLPLKRKQWEWTSECKHCMREQHRINALCRLTAPQHLWALKSKQLLSGENPGVFCICITHFIQKITQTQIHTASAGGKLSHWDVYKHVQIKWMKTTKSPRSHKVSELRSLGHRWALSTSEKLQLCISAEEFTPGICRKRNYFNIKLQLRHIIAALKSYCWTVLSYRPLLA